MAEALYDMIAAGVPHRAMEVVVDIDDLGGLDLAPGRTTKLGRAAIDELLRQFANTADADVAESGPVVRLGVELACLGSRVAVLDIGSTPAIVQLPGLRPVPQILGCGSGPRASSMACASRVTLKSPFGAAATAINYGTANVAGSRQSAILARAGKLLCLEDRLWDVEGGTDFIALSIEAARSAGRIVVLVCRDSDCVFRNRIAMRMFAETGADYIVGESEAALLLYGFHRIDSLVPRLKALSTGAILRRPSCAPLLLQDAAVQQSHSVSALDRGEFWNRFLPCCLARLIGNGSLLSANADVKAH